MGNKIRKDHLITVALFLWKSVYCDLKVWDFFLCMTFGMLSCLPGVKQRVRQRD